MPRILLLRRVHHTPGQGSTFVVKRIGPNIQSGKG